MQIIAVASGKGGVGKSLVSANLAIALTLVNKSVVLADLDLGGSNLHLVLGEHVGTRGIGTFLNNGKTKIHDIMYQTAWKGLRFIPGEAELPGAANVTSPSKKRLVKALRGLDADYLILDLGAGTSFNTIDFFLLSGCGMLVATRDPHLHSQRLSVPEERDFQDSQQHLYQGVTGSLLYGRPPERRHVSSEDSFEQAS
jgi:flagellar biosynthesis protein FlhG